MSPFWLGIAGIGVLTLVGFAMRSAQRRHQSQIDRGTVSTSWLAEHRAGPPDA